MRALQRRSKVCAAAHEYRAGQESRALLRRHIIEYTLHDSIPRVRVQVWTAALDAPLLPRPGQQATVGEEGLVPCRREGEY